MPLYVLYVEDYQDEYDILEKAISQANEKLPEWSKVILSRAKHPSELPTALKGHPDVVLADVYFQPADTSPPEPQTNQLGEIIQHVKNWDQQSPHGFPTPVIAYTGKGRAALENCLHHRGDLYDIWDKTAADANYAAWRFQRLAAELPRYRPDATIQKLIAGLTPGDCPKWHNAVLSLVKKYGEGQTEQEQVSKCRDSLQTILDSVDKEHTTALMALWDALTSSEPLLRAASPKLRGIARHSINVFWFGYWLINHSLLKAQMSTLWNDMLGRRSDAVELKTLDPMEGMNAVWVLASLFHDAGKFHEHGKTIVSKTADLFKDFDQIGMGQAFWKEGQADALLKVVQQVLYQLSTKADDPMVKALEKHITACSKKETPEHGAVAAAYLSSIAGATKDNKRFSAYAGEAARAVLIHSCLPAVYDALPQNEAADYLRIEWQRDPIASLLLFCDQIQTWDRHNPNDEKLDHPDRAELSYLQITGSSSNEKPYLKGCIDYIAPSRVGMYPKLAEEIAAALNKVILEKPRNTMLHVLQKDHWPFYVHFDCALSGKKLSIDMDFV